MTPDCELLDRFVRFGAQDAFHELVQRRFDLVYSVALRQVGGDAHLARDVAQRVFVALSRNARRLAHRPTVSGWLYRTARFTAIDVVRAERRRRQRERDAQSMQPETFTPVSDTDWNRLRPLLDDALADLGACDRDAVMLRIFDGRSFAELATTLATSEDAARMRVHRALEKLGRRLRRHGITSTAAALELALSGQATAAGTPALAASVAHSALAVASPASVAAASVGLIASMTATKTALLAAAATAVLGIAFYYDSRARRANAVAAALASEIATLQREAAAVSHINPASPALPPPTALAPSPEPTPSAGLAAQAAQLRSAYEARLRLRTSNPEFQQLAVRAARIGARVDYAGLLRRLNLTPAQLDRFAALVADYAGTSMDLAGARSGLGLAADDPALAAETARQERLFQSQLGEIIGPQGLAEYLRFEADLGMRRLLSSLAENVYYTEAPLSTVQSAQLTAIVARYFPGLTNLDPRWRIDPAAWESVLREVRAVLPPTQVAALASLGEEMTWAVESVSELNRSLNQDSR